MAAWAGISDVDDRRLAEALRTGNASALTEVYDAYAPQLYEYCHGLLRDQAEAAGALRDSLIAAQEHIGKLREPERFRSWLYALIRNTCLRRREDPDRPAQSARQEAPEIEEPGLSEQERAKLDEQRLLVHSALAGLSGRQREAVDLSVRHELDADDIAGIFGISTAQATKLLGEARSDLTKAIAAAIIARTGQEDCPSVSALVDSWPLSPDVSRKLVRHVEACPTCGERRQRRVSLTRLLQVLPVAQIPADLRVDVVTAATAPDRNETRLNIAHQAEPLDSRGWPTPPEQVRPPQPEKRSSIRLWPAVAAAACAILVVGAVMLFLPGSGSDKSSGSSEAQAAVPSDSISTEPSADPSELPLPTASAPSKTVSPSPTTTSPSPTPSRTKTRQQQQQPAPANPGALSVSGCRMSNGRSSCTIAITANGGPVSWRVTGVSGEVSASGSGTLAAGESVGVTVRRTGNCSVIFGGSGGGTVSFSPSGSASVRWSC